MSTLGKMRIRRVTLGLSLSLSILIALLVGALSLVMASVMGGGANARQTNLDAVAVLLVGVVNSLFATIALLRPAGRKRILIVITTAIVVVGCMRVVVRRVDALLHDPVEITLLGRTEDLVVTCALAVLGLAACVVVFKCPATLPGTCTNCAYPIGTSNVCTECGVRVR